MTLRSEKSAFTEFSRMTEDVVLNLFDLRGSVCWVGGTARPWTKAANEGLHERQDKRNPIPFGSRGSGRVSHTHTTGPDQFKSDRFEPPQPPTPLHVWYGYCAHADDAGGT